MALAALGGTLMEAQDICEEIIEKHGNIRLPSIMDPFVAFGSDGGKITVASVPGKTLRCATIRATMQGLIDVLILTMRDCEAEVEIEEAGAGIVGICKVQTETSSSGQRRTNLSETS
ncbi:hypothetical protein ACLMJK_002079 [Lecanora helva]